MEKLTRLILLLSLIVTQLAAPTVGLARPAAQSDDPAEKAAQLLEMMTPEEKVGQLFLVDFQGQDVSPESDLYNLIATQYIGGLVFKEANGNIPSGDNSTAVLWQLNRDIQEAVWVESQNQKINPITFEPFDPVYIPLLLGIEQAGNGYPTDQITSGITPLPSQMALGATWNLEFAYQTGTILGQELETLGFNLLFGPSLDVLETPLPDRVGDLGSSSFGGNPFWVSEMAKAYISGIHDGSEQRIVVTGQHFPGFGGAARTLAEEIPTIRKSEEQLIATELAPFLAVTGDTLDPNQTVDALLVSHIKYQGFQGSIAPSTRPISFDAIAMSDLLGLPPLTEWRDNGGVLISDDLNSNAIRRFFDPTEEGYDPRLVALSAFLAGNDILYIGNYSDQNDTDVYTTVSQTLSFFAQKYREDQAFARRVDQSVLRTLTLKYKLYNNFNLNNVLVQQSKLSTKINTAPDIAFEIANAGITQLSPSPNDPDFALLAAPTNNENIVILTDTSPYLPCAECETQETVPAMAMEQSLLQLYGPTATGQIRRQNLVSYTFFDLVSLLDQAPDQPAGLEASIQAADWLVFIMQQASENRPDSQAMHRFLADRPDLIQEKTIIAFALDAPYDLDATEVSKLSQYYGVYTKHPKFIEVAARIIMREITPQGASPVSVSGVEYDLATALTPAEDQIFTLTVFPTSEDASAEATPEGETTTPESEETAEPQPEFRTGQSVTLQTGLILDNNGNIVPDNTAVQFTLQTTTTEAAIRQAEVSGFTQDGIAQTSFILDAAGVLEVQAQAGTPPAFSNKVLVDVLVGTLPPENSNPTEDPQTDVPPTEGADTNGLDETPTATRPNVTTLGDWLLILLVTGFVGLYAYQSSANAGEVRWGIRWALSAVIGGLLVSAYLSFNLPGSQELIEQYEIWGITIAAASGALIGWFLGWLWRRASK